MVEFLTQAYRDNWSLFEQALIGSPSIAHWDLCVLTAANQRQAAAYEMQLAYRNEIGALPPATRWFVVPDVENARIGSGGATLNVLLEILPCLEPGFVPGRDLAGEAARILRGKRVLIVHSGGDSKRLPHYSAFGKLFARLPHEMPDGRASTLFDEFVVSLCGLPQHMHEGIVVASGDVLLFFDHMQLDFTGRGVIGVGMRVPAETGTHHGVFVTEQPTGRVRHFLHKPDADRMRELGAPDEEGRVDVDTGLVWFDPEFAGRLVGLAGSGPTGLVARLVRDRITVNFYGDFLGVLPPSVDRNEYLHDTSDGPATLDLQRVRTAIWDHLRGSDFGMRSLKPSRFIHFGTTSEYREALSEDLYEYRDAGWSEHVLAALDTDVRQAEESSTTVVINAMITGERACIGTGSVMENTYLAGPCRIGERSVISGVQYRHAVPFRNEPLSVVHMLPVKAGGRNGFVTRLYGIYDNPKVNYANSGATFLNQPWTEWLAAFGVDAGVIWEEIPEAERTLWNARLFPVTDDPEQSWLAVEWFQHPDTAGAETIERWQTSDRLSLETSYQAADLEQILKDSIVLEDHIRAFAYLSAVRATRFSQVAVERLGVRSPEVMNRVRAALGLLETERDELFKARALKALSDAVESRAGGDREHLVWSAELEDGAFGIVANLIRRHTTSVYVNETGRSARLEPATLSSVVYEAPARVDFGGGWSDTPPFSLEHGGTVLNAAIDLHGVLPIRVEAMYDSVETCTLESDDLGVSRSFRPEELLDFRDLSDPLALHKAALVLCGLHCTDGRGIRLKTNVNIPKGSGLGTSSIMAGAVLAALNRLTGIDASPEVLFDQVLYLEQMLTTGGGWQDQVGGMVGGIKIISSQPGLPQRPWYTPVPFSGAFQDRFTLVYTGQRRLAKRILRNIMGRYLSQDPVVVGILKEIQVLAHAMKDALVADDLETFGALMSRHWRLNIQMDPGSSNPFIDHLFEKLDPYIYGGKLAGAGGGGFAMVLARDPEAVRAIDVMLREAYAEHEVRIWPGRIVEHGLVRKG